MRDLSLWVLLASNLFSIVMAYSQQWDANEVMWLYWAQSVIIGLANYWRILTLKEFTTDGLKVNGREVEPTQGTKLQIAHFFLLHYGIFHAAYAGFLKKESAPGFPLEPFNAGFFLCVLLLLGTHIFSLRYNAAEDFKDKKPNLGAVMFYPYLRIIPMHLTIIFGAGIDKLLLFMLLKTAADVGMHKVEHRLFRKRGQQIS